MKVSVRFKKPYRMVLEGRMLSFRADQVVDLEQEFAIRLFKQGIVLPGPQIGKPLKLGE
jgi:hypothetical protein